MSEDRPGSFPEGEGPGPNGHGRPPRELDRLPPPAFPPDARGAGRRVPRPTELRAAEPEEEGEAGVPDDAFISPDEPIVRESRIAHDAFISPDEPIPPRRIERDDEVLVTGIGDDPHLAADPAAARYEDPHVADLAQRVLRLAEALRERGEAGLRTTPDMSRFESTLRAYCVGYLAALREPASEGNGFPR